MARTLKSRAFSILELMLAVGLIAVAALAMVTVFIQGIKASQNTRDLAAASEAARALMEQIRHKQKVEGYDALPTGTYSFNGWNPDPISSGFPPPPYPRQTLNQKDIVLVVYGQQPSAFVKRIQVEAYWKEGKRVVLETALHP